MPTIVFKTRIRTVSDNCILDLVVSHRLVAGEPSAAPRVVKNLPPKVDILLVSPLTITTTGMLNNRRIPAEGLMTSRITQHLLEYLKLNSSELGFDLVSDAHIAKDTGLLTFFCTASRPSWPLEVQLPHLKLLGFDMDYSWHETPSLSSPESSGLLDSVLTPFSSRLTLPYATALNNAVERFVTFQMVKRYPRIFGSWIQQLDMEQSYISSLFTSFSNILRRSSNLAFQGSYQMQLKILEKAMFASLADSEIKLSGYLGILNPDRCQHALPDGKGTVFTHAMEQIYCLAMKRRKFKSVSPSKSRLHAADDIFCDQQSSTLGFEEELHSGASGEEDLNSCFGQYGRIVNDREEDFFASDSDQLDTQLGFDQFLPTPGSSSDVSRDVEQHDANFSPILGSLPADRDPDYMSLNAAECLENGAAKVYTPDFVLSGLGSIPFVDPTPSCVERSYNDPSHVPDSCIDNCLHGCHQIMEDLPMPLSSTQFVSDTVSEWDSFISGSSVDFVEMEF